MIWPGGFPPRHPPRGRRAQKDQANALEGATYGLACLAGAGLAGLAVATIGPVPVVIFDAASYLVMALCLWAVHDLSSPARSPRPNRAPGPGSTSFLAVSRFAAGNPVL